MTLATDMLDREATAAASETEELAAMLASSRNLRVVGAEQLEAASKGVCVHLTIERWSAVVKMTYRDLGLPSRRSEDEARQMIKLGTQLLLPKALYDRIGNIESLARKSVSRYSLPVLGDLRFMPARAFLKWLTVIGELEKKFWQVRDDLVLGYKDWVAELETEYRKRARAIYRDLNRLDPEGEDMDEEERRDEAIFVIRYIQSIRQKLPTAEHIAKSFNFTFRTEYLALSNQTATQLKEARPLMEGVMGSLSDNEALALMQREAATANRRLMQDFFSDARGYLNQLVTEIVTGAIASIEKNGRLIGKSKEGLNTLFQQLRDLNFYGDDIEGQVAKLRPLIELPPDKRDTNQILTSLRSVKQTASEVVASLGYAPRSPRQVQVNADLVGTIAPGRKQRNTEGIVPEGAIISPVRRRRTAVNA